MSPFKMSDEDSLMNTSMDTGSHTSETLFTVSSPPRSIRSFSAVPSRPAGGGFGSAASRLFMDDEENVEPIWNSLDSSMDHNSVTSADGGVVQEGGPSTSSSQRYPPSPHRTHNGPTDRGSRTPFRNRGGGYKRVAERQMVARDLSFDDDEDNDDDVEAETQRSPSDMMLSPRTSPSCYRSPFRAASQNVTTTTLSSHINKSPRYRTLDGRTVQSKNPFSPMYNDESSAYQHSVEAPVALSDSLNFPVSLESSTSQGPDPAGPLLRHRLRKRDTNFHPSTFSSFAASATAQYYTRDGYPERTGRYSFTGSPIRETNIETETQAGYSSTPNSPRPLDPPTLENSTVPYKVRRRSKLQDIPGAASSSTTSSESMGSSCTDTDSQNDRKQGSFELIQNRTAYTLDMEDINFGRRNSDHSFYRWEDEISPTDVMNFPPSTPVPPTPSKPAKGRPKTHKYTPVRKPSVPPTPMPERRHRANNSKLETSTDLGSTSLHASQQQQSRFYSDFDVIAELGNGSFGNVYKVMSRLDGCMYAIKVAHRPAKGMTDKDRMLKEVYALAALSDQPDIATFHIIRYHQAWMEEHRLYIQTELCTSNLSTAIQQISPVLLPVPRRYKFLREICLALEFIHKNAMVHLDIKPENIFIKNDQFKLGDFGLVSTVSSHDVEEGDSRYMSMELLSGDHIDLTKSDIFSLGISLYEICIGGVRPLPANGPEWQSLRAAQFPPLANTPDDMQMMIKQMMDPDVGNRPSASELLKRPQLLSEEQKALLEERRKVAEANLALAERSNRLPQRDRNPAIFLAVPPRNTLRRSNTWNGF